MPLVKVSHNKCCKITPDVSETLWCKHECSYALYVTTSSFIVRDKIFIAKNDWQRDAKIRDLQEECRDNNNDISLVQETVQLQFIALNIEMFHMC